MSFVKWPCAIGLLAFAIASNLAVTGLLGSAPAAAQDPAAYPSRNITIVVPYPAGGPTDGTTSLLIGPVIKANSSDDLVKYIAKLYEAGSAIKIFCNTANAVKIMGMVEEVF